MSIRKQVYLSLSGLAAAGYIVWLRPGWWNLGFSILNTVFLVGVGMVFKRIKKDPFLIFLWLSSVVLGWFLTVRNFEVVRGFSLAGVLMLNILLITMAKRVGAKLDWVRVRQTIAVTVWKTISEAAELINLVKWLRSRGGTKLGPIAKGIVLAIPLLLVFGGLFYGADPIFAKLVDQIKWPSIKLDVKLVGEVMWAVGFFGLSMSMLEGKLAKRVKNRRILKLITETNVAVGVLEILLAIFAVIQVRYFLVSAETLKALGIVYSEYTRRGYGEMIIASLLAYGVVMWLDYSLRSQRKLGTKNVNLTKALSLLIVVEIAIFIVAATRRNYLYQAAYGFTRIRLLGFSLSAWMVAMLASLAGKIVKMKKADWFIRGTIIITTMSVILLNIFL